MTGIPLSNMGPSLNRPTLICALFGLGLAGHLAVWVLLILAGEEALYAMLGPGPALAALHALTGGTFLPIAIGASFQMLPVLCQRKPPSVRLSWVVLVLVGVGQGLQVAGLAGYATTLLALGAATTAIGLMLFIILMVPILRKGDFRYYPETRLGTALALVILTVTLVLGAAMGGNYLLPLFDRQDLMAALHGLLATYGFMGVLVLGFSPFVIPMIFLSKPQKRELGRPVIKLAVLCLVIVLSGLLLENLALLLGGVVLASVVAAVHVYHMEGLLRSRMGRKGLETVILCRFSWLCLMASLLVAAAGLVGWLGEDWLALFGVLTFHGWLLSLTLAVLARIIPFLTAMYTVHYCKRPVMVTALAPKKLLAWQIGCHMLAVVLAVGAAIAFSAPLLSLAALAGVASAILMLVFAGVIVRRGWKHRLEVGLRL